MHWQNKKVLIVGFGKSGEASLRYLLSEGARVAVNDSRARSCFENRLKNFSDKPIDWYFGEHDEALFLSSDCVVVSPGIPWNLKALKSARKKKIPIISELELALTDEKLKRSKPKIIAVTGTNGKTTTVHLIHHLLKTAGKQSVLAGNVGTPLLQCLDKIAAETFLVLEVSSYQLESTPSLRPDCAVWLNVTEDHLDWHESFEAYVSAKAKLIRQTAPEGLVIYNGEDAIVSQCVLQIPSPRLVFSVKRKVPLGGFVEEGVLYVKMKPSAETLQFPLEKVLLKGIHSWENMLASLLAVSPFISDPKLLQKGLETFEPLPHRMQEIRKKEGILYINDSKATNVGATLKAFLGTKKPIIWIAGGRDKGGNLEPLKKCVEVQTKKAIFFGEAKKRFFQFFRESTEVAEVFDLKEALALATKCAKAGDTVLFSPACSSFDMFKDYVERGETWIHLVQDL